MPEYLGIFRVSEYLGIFRVPEYLGIFRVSEYLGIFRVSEYLGILRYVAFIMSPHLCFTSVFYIWFIYLSRMIHLLKYGMQAHGTILCK